MDVKNATADPAVPKNPNDRCGCHTTVCCCGSSPKAEPEYIFLRPEDKKEYCCFEVFMTRVRIDENNEVGSYAEFIFAGYANEKEAIVPGLGTYLRIRDDWGWVNVNKRIGKFRVPRGESLNVYLRADAAEIEQAAAGGGDLGSNHSGAVSMQLSCNQNGPLTREVAIDVHRPNSQNLAAKVRVEFAAFKVDCCCD